MNKYVTPDEFFMLDERMALFGKNMEYRDSHLIDLSKSDVDGSYWISCCKTINNSKKYMNYNIKLFPNVIKFKCEYFYNNEITKENYSLLLAKDLDDTYLVMIDEHNYISRFFKIVESVEDVKLDARELPKVEEIKFNKKKRIRINEKNGCE